MTSRHRLFKVFYRLGFTPWDGHPLATSLRDLIEGPQALQPGTALDIGCGTGDNPLYLARHGWDVTGVDFVTTAIAKARAKAVGAQADVRFEYADATRLTTEAIGADFSLITDTGCLHGMNAEARDAYVREVTAIAAPGAHLLIVAFIPGASFGVPGIEPAEVKRRFAIGWILLADGDEPGLDHNGKNPARYYLFRKRPS